MLSPEQTRNIEPARALDPKQVADSRDASLEGVQPESAAAERVVALFGAMTEAASDELSGDPVAGRRAWAEHQANRQAA